MFLKLNYRFNTILLSGVFGETDKLILKLIWKFKEPTRAKIISKKNNKVGEFILSDFKT